MRRHTKLGPDLRYKWNDPDLPVRMDGTDNTTGRKVQVWVPPETAQKQYKKIHSQEGPPNWREDESYHWRTRKSNGLIRFMRIPK